MRNVISFVRAVFRNAIYFLTSSLVAAALTVYEHLRGSSVGVRAFLVVAISLAVCAFYKAWSEERQRTKRLESDLSITRQQLEAERSRKPAEEAQAKLLNAQREEMERLQRIRQAEEQHEERMKFLTAPGKGIRYFVGTETSQRKTTLAFTADMLASSLLAEKAEIEEALRILQFQGFAKVTNLPGHWFIES